MIQDLISIIVPLYNNEMYIGKCIDSILKQTYQNFELIIVDDGSTDRGAAVCEKYLIDKRVAIFNKKNGGLASARNYGLSKCSSNSKYTIFIDSDDYVKESYLEELHNNRTDLTICNICNVYSDYRCIINETSYSINKFSNLKSNKDLALFLSTGLFNPAWNKLYQTQIIRKNNLQFRNIEIAEDIEFNLQYFKYCNEIVYINKPLYYYVHRKGTLTSKVSKQMYENYISIHKQLLSIFDKTLSKYINQYVYHQYLSISLRFIKIKKYNEVYSYLKRKELNSAIEDYSCSSVGDRLLYIFFKYKFLRLIKLIFLR